MIFNNNKKKNNGEGCNVCPPVNQGFEPDESVENDDQQSPERESGEHSLYAHIHLRLQYFEDIHS